MEIGSPYSKQEIIDATRNFTLEVASFFGSIPDEIFFTKPPKGWSPADNIRHLNKSTWAVLIAIRLPKRLLRLLFFKSSIKPRHISEIKDAYLAKLASGRGAGLYAPIPRKTPARAAEKKAILIKKWSEIGEATAAAISRWSESELDEIRLPHPILGRIPVREMILFGALHCMHHAGIVKKRMDLLKASA